MGRALASLLLAAGLMAVEPPPLALAVTGDVLHANTLEFGAFALRDVVAKPDYTGRDLRFTKATATAYGGAVAGEVNLHFPVAADEPLVYSGDLVVTDGDLGQLLRQFGSNSDNLSGRVNGRVRFSVPAGRLDQMTGEGSVTIDRATLVQLSLLTNLLAGDPGGSRGQDRLEVRFTIADGRIRLSGTRLYSPAATIAITGTIGLDGSLRLTLVPSLAFKLVDRIPGLGAVVAPALTSVGARVARVLVRGQVTDPVLVPDPFRRQRD